MKRALLSLLLVSCNGKATHAECTDMLDRYVEMAAGGDPEMPPAEALVRSQVLRNALSPEEALGVYLDNQPRLKPRRDDLMHAARPLFDLMEQEEALR